jgi:hypothetical protein
MEQRGGMNPILTSLCDDISRGISENVRRVVAERVDKLNTKLKLDRQDGMLGDIGNIRFCQMLTL